MKKCKKACVDKISKFEEEEYKIKARSRQKKCCAEKKVRQKNSNTNETVSPMVPTKVKNKLKQSKMI